MIPVAVTESEFRKGEALFRAASEFACFPAPAAETALAAAIRANGARHAIVGTDRYTGPLYDALPRGGVIARFGVGHDGIDKAQAAARGLFCCNTPDVLNGAVAEFALGLMIAAARHIASCGAATARGGWQPRIGGEVAGKTLAVIGVGRIGSRLAAIAKQALAMRVIGVSPRPPQDRRHLDHWTADFNAAAVEADFVSLHIPDTPAPRDFLNAERLARLRPAAIVINTARGGVLDENALYDAVAAGAIAGAALDVFKTEPYAPQSGDRDLRTLDRVLMTPHIGSSTAEACERVARRTLHNLALAEAGRTDEMDRL